MPLADANGIILVGYYCDGILVAILAVNLTLLMFDVRVLGTDVDCEDEVLTATFVLTNHGTNTIPSGTEFDYEFTTDPALTEVVGQVVSGTYTLLADLAPTETIEMSIEYENPECKTGSDITLTITDVPTGYGNFNPATLTDDITYEYIAPPMGLRMLFDDIANAPVVDPTNVGQWNTFFDLPTNGAVFTSAVVAGNEVTLVGGGNMTIVVPGTFSGNAIIISVFDDAGILDAVSNAAFYNATGLQDFVSLVVENIGIAGQVGAFKGATSLNNFQAPALLTMLNDIGDGTLLGTAVVNLSFPNLASVPNSAFKDCALLETFAAVVATTVAGYAFQNCTSATLINIPLCVNLGNDPTDASVFDGITGQVITLNIAAVNATNNAGGVHASVAYLIANNTATVNYI